MLTAFALTAPSHRVLQPRRAATHSTRRPSFRPAPTMSAFPRIVVGDVPNKCAELVQRLSNGNDAFSVAVSGGSLPRLLGTGMAALPGGAPDTSGWKVFLADERIVPLDHADSNYLAATAEAGMKPVPIDPSMSAEAAAVAYERALVDALGPSGALDLALLGLGPDGHTCSLFPEHPLLAETERLVAPITDSPKPPPSRITLTLRALAAARHVAFIVTGAGKADILQDILENPESKLPGALVKPESGNVTWFLDEAAASKLKKS